MKKPITEATIIIAMEIIVLIFVTSTYSSFYISLTSGISIAHFYITVYLHLKPVDPMLAHFVSA